MLDSFWSYVFQIMSFFSGQPFQPEWELKARLILQAGVFLLLFCAAFFYFYRKYFWQDLIHRQLFFWTFGILGLVIIAKFAIFYFAKGYIPDRLLFFAIPSPKFSSVFWFLLAGGSFAAFLFLRKYFENWPVWKFLICLWLIFWAFSSGIAGMRQGSPGIYEPLTRTNWEYSGDLPLVKNIPQFFHDYVSLNPRLSSHGSTHPPGYTLILYILKSIFRVDLLGLAILITGIGGAFIFPVYYFWKQLIGDKKTKEALQFFIFLPSIVLFSATSMDAIMLTFSWLALLVIFWGWKKGGLYAFVGGILSGVALLMNFLFFFFGLVILFFLIYLWRQMDRQGGWVILGRTIWVLVGFLGFFATLYSLTGYSIVANFFVANAVQQNVIETNTPSIFIYLLFAFMNIFAFGFYLGIPNVILFLRQGTQSLFGSERFLTGLGFLVVLIFLVTGLFQGETERIWLFLTPLFMLSIYRGIVLSGVNSLAAISLLVSQIVLIQTLFFTYW